MKGANVVIHAHSVWSYDGSWQLEQIARLFGRLGYDAVMMTEHDTGFGPSQFAEYRQACAEASTARCQLVPGIEYSSPDNDIHILTWGLDHFLAEHRPVLETLEQVHEKGGAAVYAHPIRREAWKKYDTRWTKYLSAIEMWNRKSDGVAPSQQAVKLSIGTGLSAVVGMDFHRKNQIWPLSNYAPSAARETMEHDLVAALHAGRMVPKFMGRDILDNNGEILEVKLRRYKSLEKARVALRDFLRRGA